MSGLIHSAREVNILKLDFACLDAAFDLQTASDSLVVLHTYATSLYVCFDSHLLLSFISVVSVLTG
jgi:hypothetical protein